ncbi:cyclin-dependent kinase inhibitor 1Ca [Thalassophryne amazonica]|uniref:cyclin-dependent kinase inhibitor 1Ca n=1 Tax=Thalassophryne amazonica TaxID=390379 RepID=UPI0014709AB1|nr:cyclin-dependent kinase inhibitor 1Ca [Thalassophryne amazonica]
MSLIRRRDRVCRTLFGPMDHDQLRLELKLKLKETLKEDSHRWNFNFQTESPLPGRYQWEEVPADCAAAFYQESSQLKAAVEISNSDDIKDKSTVLHQENCSSISNTLRCPAEVTPRKRTLSKPETKSRTSTKMTDFFVKRRRTSEHKSILNPFLTTRTR